MTKSLVFRIIRTLEARGYLVRDPDRAVFSLGYRMGALADHASQQKGLVRAAQPVMDELVQQTSETVNLIVRDGEQALVVATREGRHTMRLFAQPGRHGPLYAGGGSLLLLAYAPDVVKEAVINGPLTAYTSRTISDPDALRRRIERIRNQGWNIAQDDLDEGAFSVAAPIRNANGEVVAALSVAGALVRFDENRRERYLAITRAAVAEISVRLGAAPNGKNHDQAA